MPTTNRILKHEEKGGGIWFPAGTQVTILRTEGDSVVIRGTALRYCSNPAKQPVEMKSTMIVPREAIDD